MPNINYERMYRRDESDRERDAGRGDVREGEPTVTHLVKVISSSGATIAKTTFKCEICDLVNPETEGAALDYDPTENIILVTNVSGDRPATDALTLAFKVGNRFAMEYVRPTT